MTSLLAATHRGLTTIDWMVVAVYAAAMLALGVYYSRRETSARSYFTAEGGMGRIVIGISLFATILSTISYLSTPGEMIKNGPVILVQIFHAPFTFVIIGFWLIPAIMQRRVTSAYELLEDRLGVAGRTTAALIFVSVRLVWMGLMLNMAAKALVRMLDLDPAMQPWIVMITGIVAVAYTALGGLRAVVMSDVIQFLLLFGGAWLTIALVSYQMGGFGWFPTQWAPHWDHQPVFSLDPHIRVTVIGTIVSGVIWWVATAGSDQVMIQRYMATRDAAAARRSFLVNCLADFSVAITLGLVGLALLGFYMAHPDRILGEGGVYGQADHLFPQFIANQLPVGVAGLVVVALFAAAMSSIDSGINSVTAVVLTDFVNRFRRKQDQENDAHELWVARFTTVLIGIAIIVVNTFIDKVPGNYLDVTAKTVNLLPSPLFGLFFMALFVRFATPYGAISGCAYGSTAAVLIAFWDVLTGGDPLSWQWINPVALVVTLSSGVLMSLLPTRGRSGPVLAAWCILAAAPVMGVFYWATQIVGR